MADRAMLLGYWDGWEQRSGFSLPAVFTLVRNEACQFRTSKAERAHLASIVKPGLLARTVRVLRLRASKRWSISAGYRENLATEPRNSSQLFTKLVGPLRFVKAVAVENTSSTGATGWDWPDYRVYVESPECIRSSAR